MGQHFKISAAVVKQLGEELVSDEVTAIMELVKNSYDAKASYVIVEINNKEKTSSKYDLIPQTRKGFVIISDDGLGMASADVFSRWLTISMSEKRKEKNDANQTENHRTPLGEKGVGRLSTQRIGNVVDLITGVNGEDYNTQISFKWSDFNEDTVLDDVDIKTSTIKKAIGEKGTKIIIKELRDLEVWEGNQFSRIVGELSQLILPGSTKGFKVHLKHNNEIVNIEDINSKVQANAICIYNFTYTEEEGLIIKGKIKLAKLRGNKNADFELFSRIIEPDNGKSFFSFLNDKTLNSKEFLNNVTYLGNEGFLMEFEKRFSHDSLGLITIPKPKALENKNPLNEIEFENQKEIEEDNAIEERIIAEPGPFKGCIYEFSFIDTTIQNTFDSFSDFKKIVQNQVGIRIYRDGFGIKPYGLEGNDWLKLSEGSTSGASIYGLRLKNVIGYVEISAKENKSLKEKTDREGFMESPFSSNFFRIANKVKDEINSSLEKTRRSYNEYRKYVASENLGLKDAKTTFNNLKKTAKDSQKILKASRGLEIRLYELKNSLNEIENEGVGSSKNELRNFTIKIEAHINDAAKLIQDLKSLVESTSRLDEYIDYLQPQIQSLETQLKDFTELAALGLTAEALSHELSHIVDRLNRLTTRISRIKNSSPQYFNEFSTFIRDVKGIITSFRKQLSHLDPALNYVRENKETFDIKGFLQETVDFYTEKFDNKIDISTNSTSDNFLIRVNRGRIVQIIDNIILNSEYWLLRKKELDISFKPEVKIEIINPFIRIFDNGFGIENSIEDTLFQPFITTKPHNAGRGLGLFIVQQLLDSIGCTISLLPQRNQYGKRYIFQINLSTLVINNNI